MNKSKSLIEQVKGDLISIQSQENFDNWLKNKVKNHSNIQKTSTQEKIYLDYHGEYNPCHCKKFLVLIDNINLPKCKSKIINMLYYNNRCCTIRRGKNVKFLTSKYNKHDNTESNLYKLTFEHITGIKLPKNSKQAKELIKKLTPDMFNIPINYTPKRKLNNIKYKGYYILNDGISILAVEKLNIYGINFFITDVCNCGWQIYNMETGSPIPIFPCQSREEVIKTTKSFINSLKNGLETYIDISKNHINKYGTELLHINL